MPTTDQMAQFGAKVYALMTFSQEWQSDTTQAIDQLAVKHGLDMTDRTQARHIVTQFALDPSEVGDTAPDIQFNGTGCPGYETEEQDRVKTWVLALHDARDRDDHETEKDVLCQLVEHLYAYAAITIK